MGRHSTDTVVIIPAFNEGKVIGQVLDDLGSYPYDVIVVDDGSCDDTIQQALSHPVTLLHHRINLGQGAALQTGICYALAAGRYRYLVSFDADGQHSASDIAGLLAPLQSGEVDVALGSRFMKSGRVVNLGLLRRLVLLGAINFTLLATGMRLTDTHNGLRAFTASAAAHISITQNRMAHASEVLSQIKLARLRWCEVPVTIRYTPYSKAKGQSLLNSINILWDLFTDRM